MKKYVVFFTMFYIPVFLASCAPQSQSSRTKPAASEVEPENVKTVRSTPVSTEDLKALKRIAVFISGSEAFYTTMMEDALSIDLQNLGFEVVNRLEIEKRVTREWKDWYLSEWKPWYSKWIDWSYLPDSIKRQSQPPEPPDEAEIGKNEVEIGKLVGVDAVLTGTILEGRQQYSNVKEGSGAGAEKIVITAISLQLIDVKKEKILVEVLIGYRHGVSIPYVSKDVMGFFSDRMR